MGFCLSSELIFNRIPSISTITSPPKHSPCPCAATTSTVRGNIPIKTALFRLFVRVVIQTSIAGLNGEKDAHTVALRAIRSNIALISILGREGSLLGLKRRTRGFGFIQNHTERTSPKFKQGSPPALQNSLLVLPLIRLTAPQLRPL